MTPTIQGGESSSDLKRVCIFLGLVLAVGCSSSQKAPPKAASAEKGAAATAKNASADQRLAAGSSIEQPVMVCGPRESYRYVAETFRCPDGKNPLGGNLEKAQHSRVGSVDHPQSGHIVDVYRVDCGREVEVFVDMYGCEQYEAQLEKSEPSDSLQKLLANYEEQDFGAVIDQCGKSPTDLEADESMGCMVLVPASFFVVGNAAGAVHVLKEMCTHMPPPSSLSNARANLVMQVTSAVAHTAEKNGEEITPEDGAAIVGAFAEACQVTPQDLERAIERAQTL
jgi:hypothetical protein